LLLAVWQASIEGGITPYAPKAADPLPYGLAMEGYARLAATVEFGGA